LQAAVRHPHTPHPTDLDGVPPHYKKKQSLSNTSRVVVAITTTVTAIIVVVVPPISKIKGEGKYWEYCLHRRPGGVAGYSKETLNKITKTPFGMTEVHAATARGHFSQREAAPAACKLASPRNPSHGQCEYYLCQLRYYLYSCTLWRFGAQYQIFVGPLATRRECHISLKRRV
jgi:hypothetical protein